MSPLKFSSKKLKLNFIYIKKKGKQRAKMIYSRFSVPCKVKVNIANKEGECVTTTA